MSKINLGESTKFPKEVIIEDGNCFKELLVGEMNLCNLFFQRFRLDKCDMHLIKKVSKCTKEVILSISDNN